MIVNILSFGNATKPLAGFLANGLVMAAIFWPVSPARASGGQDQAIASLATVAVPEPVRHPRVKSYLKQRWGVEVMFVRQTAAGYMLEFRYRVLDAKKAKPLFERRIKPVLTLAETGEQFIVPTPPTTGALRNSNPPIAGRNYWMFFANPGKHVKPGQQVSIEIGEFRADGLFVQ